jgi:sec-independent protein translocase protein TatB
MFDFSFTELLLIGVVALVVIGPERLPKVARTAGILLGRMQRYVATVKADISREMEELEQLKDLKNLKKEVEQTGGEIESSIRQNMLEAESEVKKISDEVGPGFAKASQSPTPAVEPTPPGELAGAPSAAKLEPPRPESDAATQPGLAELEAPSPQMELALDSPPASTPTPDKPAERAA